MTASTAFPSAATRSAPRHDMCPRCWRPARHDRDDLHQVSDVDARVWGARAGFYHDECCPECNGVFG